MWILYVFLYLLGVLITASIMGYLEGDFADNPGPTFGVMLWPFLFVLLFLFVLFTVPYHVGLWTKKYKDQIDLKSYLKETFSMK